MDVTFPEFAPPFHGQDRVLGPAYEVWEVQGQAAVWLRRIVLGALHASTTRDGEEDDAHD